MYGRNAMKRIKTIYQRIKNITGDISAAHIGAYAAQSAYFYVVYDPDYFAASYAGTVHTSDEGGRDDRRDPGVSVIGGNPGHINGESGV